VSQIPLDPPLPKGGVSVLFIAALSASPCPSLSERSGAAGSYRPVAISGIQIPPHPPFAKGGLSKIPLHPSLQRGKFAEDRNRPFGAAQGPESVEGADSAKAALGYDGWEVALTSAPRNRGEDDAPAAGLVCG
jgi:hypothetical protein